MRKSYVPLNIDDLVVHEENRVLLPSPWVLAQYQQSQGEAHKTSTDEYYLEKDSYRFDEIHDSTKKDTLPEEVRTLLDNIIRQYAALEEDFGILNIHNIYDGLSEETVAKLIGNAIDAVQRFDHQHNIGNRKLQNRKTVNERLMEFFKYAGRHGVSYNTFT